MKSAVLFLVFNRPDTTKQVFEAIRKAQPPRLYVAADGPRADRQGEREKCEEVRRIATAVDWECEVKTLFRENNLGCKIGVSGGIDWFFEHEEEGIILEDDCLPAKSFFDFVDEALICYKDDIRIGAVCGYNPLGEFNLDKPFFASYPHIWGWGTWRRVWMKYSVDITEDIITVKDIIFEAIQHNRAAMRIAGAAALIKKGELDTWDLQYGLLLCKFSLLSVYPQKNTVKNIGFHDVATHTKSGVSAMVNAAEQMAFDFSAVDVHRSFDMLRFNSEYPGLWRRFILKFLK